MVALLVVGGGFLGDAPEGAALGCMALAPMGFVHQGPLMDEFEEGQGGGGTDALDPFQKEVLAGINQVKKQMSEVEAKISEVDKEGKQLAEDFDKSAKSFDGTSGDVKGLMNSVAQLKLKIHNETRSSYGSALDQISNDPELRSGI